MDAGMLRLKRAELFFYFSKRISLLLRPDSKNAPQVVDGAGLF
jgi:hypothetical protein